MSTEVRRGAEVGECGWSALLVREGGIKIIIEWLCIPRRAEIPSSTCPRCRSCRKCRRASCSSTQSTPSRAVPRWLTYNWVWRDRWNRRRTRWPNASPSCPLLPTQRRRNVSAAPARRPTASRCTASALRLARTAGRTAPASPARTTRTSRRNSPSRRLPSRKEDSATARSLKNDATARSPAASSDTASASTQE